MSSVDRLSDLPSGCFHYISTAIIVTEHGPFQTTSHKESPEHTLAHWKGHTSKSEIIHLRYIEPITHTHTQHFPNKCGQSDPCQKSKY